MRKQFIFRLFFGVLFFLWIFRINQLFFSFISLVFILFLLIFAFIFSFVPFDSSIYFNLFHFFFNLFNFFFISQLFSSSFFLNFFFNFFHFYSPPQSMAARISQRVNIPYDYCLSAVNELQANAIEKLKSRDTFKDTGEVKVQ